jgi:predicted component of type VI protein secretion system
MPALLVAPNEGPNILVGRLPVLVGRHSGCDARIGSFQVSRQHCCLAGSEGAIEVRDLNITNGVRVNGRWVASGRLRPGDELSIAHVRYRLHADPAAQPGPAGPPAGAHRMPVATYTDEGAAS